MSRVAFGLLLLLGFGGPGLAHVTGTDHVHTPDEVIRFDHPVEPAEVMVVETE